MLCPKCGTGLSVDEKYCHQCGLKQGVPTLIDGLKELLMPIGLLLIGLFTVISLSWLMG